MIKKGEFVRIDYTGKLKDSGIIFDTTNADIAKANNAFDPKVEYKLKSVCVGEGHILSGLDKELENHKIGDIFTVTLQPEDAFGKKSAKLIQLISANKFKSQRITPRPGLQVNVDNNLGDRKSVV